MEKKPILESAGKKTEEKSYNSNFVLIESPLMADSFFVIALDLYRPKQ